MLNVGLREVEGTYIDYRDMYFKSYEKYGDYNEESGEYIIPDEFEVTEGDEFFGLCIRPIISLQPNVKLEYKELKGAWDFVE